MASFKASLAIIFERLETSSSVISSARIEDSLVCKAKKSVFSDNSWKKLKKGLKDEKFPFADSSFYLLQFPEALPQQHHYKFQTIPLSFLVMFQGYRPESIKHRIKFSILVIFTDESKNLQKHRDSHSSHQMKSCRRSQSQASDQILRNHFHQSYTEACSLGMG